MKKLLLLILFPISLTACTSVAPYAIAVDDSTIYYNECFNVLDVWHKCEMKSKSTNGKPIMQRTQTVIADPEFLNGKL
jgi:hypothetical protein